MAEGDDIPFLLPFRLLHVEDLQPRRHQLQGEGPPDELLPRVEDLPAVCVGYRRPAPEKTGGAFFDWLARAHEFLRGQVLESLQ